MSTSDADHLVLHLEGFEGPLDLLLDLARAQKVDLAKISILALVETVPGGDRGRAASAAGAGGRLAGNGGMARLAQVAVAGADGADADEGELAADALASRLRELSAIRAAAVWLSGRPQLGHDVFARGAPEDHTEIDRSRLALDLGSLVRAYLQGCAGAPHAALPAAATVAMEREGCAAATGQPAGQPAGLASLEQFLPDTLAARWNGARHWPVR